MSLNVNIDKFDKFIFMSTTDLCRLPEGVLSNVFTKIFRENFRDAAKYSLKCPFLKGNNSILNQKFTDKSIPVVQDLLFKYNHKMVGRVAGKNKLIHLYTQTMYGNLRKNEAKIR